MLVGGEGGGLAPGMLPVRGSPASFVWADAPSTAGTPLVKPLSAAAAPRPALIRFAAAPRRPRPHLPSPPRCSAPSAAPPPRGLAGGARVNSCLTVAVGFRGGPPRFLHSLPTGPSQHPETTAFAFMGAFGVRLHVLTVFPSCSPSASSINSINQE